jgi:FkbH-like protein
MFETEVNRRVEFIGSLPADVLRRFAEFKNEVVARTVLPWGEHCTECNFPTCYTSCALYTPRTDGACRLFIDGSVRLDFADGLNPYLLKIRFKQWGKLWSVGNIHLFDTAEATKKEERNLLTGAVTRNMPLPGPLKRRVLGKVGYLRRQAAEAAEPSSDLPDALVIEAYNPNTRTINLTVSVWPPKKQSRPFQKIVPLPPGFARGQVAVSEIMPVVDLRRGFELEIVPNDTDDTTLYFGLVDFVKTKARSNGKSEIKTAGGKKWKCIVWDLDNTLWDGTLIEDGPNGIRLRQDVVDVIKAADQRGILHSIASKNNPDDAMKVLRMCGLEQYFLHPQISWEPKSQAVAKIAQLLSIGIDTLAFVDDQPFEREEVKQALPEVSVIDTAEFKSILQREECNVPVTEESKLRREMYRQQEQRNAVLEAHSGDYLAFLRDCNIQLSVTPLNDENLERVYELAQRTNQMNFSGARYPREQLQELKSSPSHETFVLKCTDKFGSYGIVGFAVVDVREPRLVDLMFSCRIQAKRIEHAFLSYLLTKYSRPERRDFLVNYKKTPKNTAHGKVFDDIGFQHLEDKDGVSSLVFRKECEIPNDGVITITESKEGR